MPDEPDTVADTPGAPEHSMIYRDLRHRIVHLRLPPGSRLREQALAREFNVSRTPIRRVLDRLAHEGLVVITPGIGASVSLVNFQDLREVWALRLKIVELIADFVNLPPAQNVLDRLGELVDRLDSIDTADELAQLYDDYHETMLAVMSNGPLRSIYDQLYAQTARVFVQLLPSLDLDTEIEAIRDEITLTRQACVERSGPQLAEARTKHMHLLLGRISRSLTIVPPSAQPGFDRVEAWSNNRTP